MKYLSRDCEPPLTRRHKAARLAFAKTYANTDWRNVVFSDETKLEFGDHGRKSWCCRGARKKRIVRAHPPSCQLWAAVGWRRSTSLVPRSVMNAGVYIATLRRHLPAVLNIRRGMMFQQDNAPSHTAKVVKSYLKSAKVKALEWPALSPDLNLIENLWHQLKVRVTRRVAKLNDVFPPKEALIGIAQRQWTALVSNPAVLQPLFDSMPDRLHEVIQNRGGFTHY